MTATPFHGSAEGNALPIHLLMVLCSILVSTSFTVGAAITNSLDPRVLTFVRFLLAVSLLTPYVARRYGLGCSRSLFFRSLAIGGCVVFFFWCMFLSLRYTTPLNTSVLFTLVPSISGIYAMILVGERLKRQQLIALFCGLAGALWVIFGGDVGRLFAMHWNRGDLIFLTGCMAMGLHAPLVKLLHRGQEMLHLTYWVPVTGLVWLMLFGVPAIARTDWGGVPLQVWAGVGYLAVFTTIITFFLAQYCVLYIGPTRVTAYSYLYPGLVLVIDLTLGRGLPPLRVLPGIVIVLLAMVVLQVRR